MTETMRERVARAICAKSADIPLTVSMTCMVNNSWSEWLPEADAVIAAMAPSYSSLLAAAQGAVDAWFNEPNPTESDGWPKQMLVLRDAISAARAETTS